MSTSTQPYLRIQLFADFEISLEGQVYRGVEKPRQKSLIAYLALNQGKPQARSHLAFTFWPDSAEKQALTNLRNLLHGIRQSLPAIDRFLEIDNNSIYLRFDPDCEVDVSLLEKELATKNEQKAVNIYAGPLLPKSHDEWIEPEREHLRLRVDRALICLIERSRKTGNLPAAIQYSKIRIQHDPLSENSQYTHIELLAQNGDNAAALLAYQSYERRLKAELEIAPGDQIQALRSRITARSARKEGASLLSNISKKSIAVLPFETHSQSEQDRFFADGIHDDLITRISRIQGFQIISRSSTLGYRGTDKSPKQIAQELGVATLIEGTIQRQGNRLRINIQIIDTQTGFHLWAENYTRESTVENIFSLQNEITDAIAKELQGVLLPQEPQRNTKLPTTSLAALEAYFYGQARGTYSTSEGIAKAIVHYKKAIQLDPNFAEAHAALALAHLGQIHVSGKEVEAQIAIARAHIAKALELNNALSDTYVSLGQLQHYETDYIAAERSYTKAIELDPNNALAYSLYSSSRHYQFGDTQSALELSRKANELAPRDTAPRMELASILMSLGRTEEAKSLLLALTKEYPQNSAAIARLAWLHDENLNHYDEAIRLYRQAYALDPTNQEISSRIAWAYLKLGDKDQFITWSERDIAVAPASHKVTFLKGFLHEFRNQLPESVASFAALKKSDLFYDWSAYKVTAATVKAGRYEDALERFTVSYPWITDPDCAVNQSNCIQIIDYVYLLHLNGRQDQANTLAKRVLEFLPQATRLAPIGYQYYDSHLHLALNDKAAAYAALQEYVDAGGCTSHFGTEAYTHVIREEPEFQRLLAIVESRLSKQRDQLAQWDARGELAPLPELELSLGR